MKLLVKYLPLVLGVGCIPLGLFSCVASSNIKPMPTPPPNIEYPETASSAIKDWPEFIQRMRLPLSDRPEFCILTSNNTLTEVIEETYCYHYIKQVKGLRKYRVSSYGYNSENEKLGGYDNYSYKEPVYISLTEYKAGKYRRFFGDEELLPAEQEVQIIKVSATWLGLLMLISSLPLMLIGCIILLPTLKSKRL